jgi:hypothetical protein
MRNLLVVNSSVSSISYVTSAYCTLLGSTASRKKCRWLISEIATRTSSLESSAVKLPPDNTGKPTRQR